MADIRVLMVGGRRTGKSSILAGMIHQMANDVELCKKYLQITACRGNDSTAVDLDKKRQNLVSFIEKNPTGVHYLVDFGADDCFNIYNFKAKIPKPNGGTYSGNIKIEFIDSPGESYERDTRPELYEQLVSYVPNSDIFVIAIDTPYLMDDQTDGGKFMRVSGRDIFKELLQEYVKFKRDDDYKKVIFTLVKCEKWRNNLEEVSNRLKQDNYFGPLMKFLDADKRWSYEILPVLTAGGIEFSEFGMPLKTKVSEERCSRLGNAPIYRMEDGSNRILKESDVIVNEEFSLHLDYYSWFKNLNNEYKPENCDQLALHIWRYIIFKTEIECSHSIFPNWLRGFPSMSVMKDLIKRMEREGLIVDSGDGIKHIRKIEKV